MSNTTRGLFISFEGIDGAGKSTHIDGLAQAFEARGRQVTLTREPGGTLLAESLRQLVLNQPMDALTEALLVFAARRDHLKLVIEPALARGDVVLCDRFTDATFAYQGGGRGFDGHILSTLEKWVQDTPQGLCEPDLTLWFVLDPEVAAQRLSQARVPDRFESQPVDFFRLVHEGYRQRCESAPHRFIEIAAHRSREEVWASVMSSLVQRGVLT